MSAFIVEDKTINTIVTMLKNSEHVLDSSWYKRELKENGFDLDHLGGDEKLGQAMFKLNVQAITERYGEGEAEKFRKLDYKYSLQPHYTVISAYKNLRCWLYQCTEGDVPKTPLFKLMHGIADSIADHIVSRLPAYEKAPWC